MAGFFGLFDYTKEGPGVPKDAPPKSRFVIFFEVLARKFWNIIKVNFMFAIFNIPALLFFLFFCMYFLNLLTQAKILAVPVDEIAIYLMSAIVPLFLIFVCFPLITVGPAQAGMTYVLRNYSREEHAFIWSDFIEHAKKNFKQSMIVGLINCIATILFMLDIYIYFNVEKSNLLITVASAMIIMVFMLFIMMSMYIYPMMVTFKLTIKQLYKNAFLFAIMKFFPNLLIIIICFLIIIVPFYFFPVIGYLLLFVITFGLISYITNFYVYSKLDKYMIQPAEEEEDAFDNFEDGEQIEDVELLEEGNLLSEDDLSDENGLSDEDDLSNEN